MTHPGVSNAFTANSVVLFKEYFQNENYVILIQFSRIAFLLTLLAMTNRLMVWRHGGDKPLFESMTTKIYGLNGATWSQWVEEHGILVPLTPFDQNNPKAYRKTIIPIHRTAM